MRSQHPHVLLVMKLDVLLVLKLKTEIIMHCCLGWKDNQTTTPATYTEKLIYYRFTIVWNYEQ